MKGIVFNIQKFSIHDGPGIRTTVFFKGCPLRCEWCSNPESQLSSIQVLHDEDKCIKCQTCVNVCPQHAITFDDHISIDYNKCIGCMKCFHACPSQAISVEGEYQDVESIVEECMKDLDFYEESGGGVTISGGEGMSQPAFLKELVLALKDKGLHVAIETTGYVESDTFKELAPLFDLLLFDVKHYNRDQHYQGTHVYNDLIIDNLKWAINNNINVLPRIPVIPDFNDSLDDASGLSNLLKECHCTKVQLLPFHQFGENKYHLLHKVYPYENNKAFHKEDLIDYQNIFFNNNIECFF